MVKYLFDKGKKAVCLEPFEIVEVKADSEVQSYIEAMKFMWMGAINCDRKLLHNIQLITPFGTRSYSEDSEITGGLTVDGKSIVIAECGLDTVNIKTAVDSVVHDDNDHLQVFDTSMKLTGRRELQKRVLKDKLNTLLVNCKVVGDIHASKVNGKMKITDDFHIVDLDGNPINTDNMTDDNEYLVTMLMTVMHQYDKFVNVLFVNLEGITNAEMISDMLKLLVNDTRDNRNTYVHLYNNNCGVHVGQRVVNL